MRTKYTAIIAIFAIAIIIGTVAAYAYLSQPNPQPIDNSNGAGAPPFKLISRYPLIWQ